MIIDMNRNAFTIVELLVVITIMGILLVLTAANLSSSQISARDSERKTDVETLVSFLDTYYTNGSDLGNITGGEYPSTFWSNGNANLMQNYIGYIDVKPLTAPGITDPTLTLKSATNNVQTTAGVAPQPSPDQYVYQPLQSDGTLCTLESQECRKFNLYYKTETGNTVYMVTGKNQ